MRLDFNVLWVEDQPANVKAQAAAIDRRIRTEGFRLQVEYAVSIAEAKKYLSSDIYGDHIDLILMDYNLGTGTSGDAGLVEVRRIFPFKDVIFYSASAADLPRLVADKQIQGIFCSERETLPDEVLGLFETLIKKVLDIDHARGIIMGSSSDIDGLIFDCLANHLAKENGSLSEGGRKIIELQLKDIRKSFEKAAEDVAAAQTIEDLRDLHLVYSSTHRLKLLRKLLEASGSHAEFCEATIAYVSNTMPRRNDLAHIRVERNGFSRRLLDRNGNEMTKEVIRELRHALLQYQEILEALAVLLKPS